uniref:Uncharacterized protein n=1 Tax=Tanacetum cinerariifolium TaxID=118510 RepID=A0A699IGP5_TANCI|nr:hypothetical protein [Tanacetum cinerariifolium]
MAGPIAGNQIARWVFDDLVDFNRETFVARYMEFFFEQQIFDRRCFINRMREELQTSTNLLGQLTTLIVELEAFPDPGEVFDTLMCHRDDMRDEQARVDYLNDCITCAQEQIEIKEEHVRVMEAEDNDVRVYYPAFVVLGIVYGCYRLEFELEALGESKGTAKCLEHMRVIVGRDAVTLGKLEALLARAHVGAALKTGFMADMEVED